MSLDFATAAEAAWSLPGTSDQIRDQSFQFGGKMRRCFRDLGR